MIANFATVLRSGIMMSISYLFSKCERWLKILTSLSLNFERGHVILLGGMCCSSFVFLFLFIAHIMSCSNSRHSHPRRQKFVPSHSCVTWLMFPLLMIWKFYALYMLRWESRVQSIRSDAIRGAKNMQCNPVYFIFEYNKNSKKEINGSLGAVSWLFPSIRSNLLSNHPWIANTVIFFFS